MSRAPTYRWADWDLSAWCPVLSPVPSVEGVIPTDPEAHGAAVIHRMRKEFYGASVSTCCDSPRGANHPPDLEAAQYLRGVSPANVMRARFVFSELSRITSHTLWGEERGAKSRRGDWHTLGLGHALEAASGPAALQSRDTILSMIAVATRRAMNFARAHAEMHGEPAPFGGLSDPEPAEVLALDAIFEAATAMHDILRGAGDRENRLAHAVLLAHFAIELRDAATLAAQAPAVQRVEKTNAATRGPRAKRAPGLDSWLDEQLKADPHAKNETLWAMLKAGDMEDAEIREAGADGEILDFTRTDGSRQSMRRKQFNNRCTDARGRVGITSNRGRKPTIPR